MTTIDFDFDLSALSEGDYLTFALAADGVLRCVSRCSVPWGWRALGPVRARPEAESLAAWVSARRETIAGLLLAAQNRENRESREEAEAAWTDLDGDLAAALAGGDVEVYWSAADWLSADCPKAADLVGQDLAALAAEWARDARASGALVDPDELRKVLVEIFADGLEALEVDVAELGPFVTDAAAWEAIAEHPMIEAAVATWDTGVIDTARKAARWAVAFVDGDGDVAEVTCGDWVAWTEGAVGRVVGVSHQEATVIITADFGRIFVHTPDSLHGAYASGASPEPEPEPEWDTWVDLAELESEPEPEPELDEPDEDMHRRGGDR